ncbi:hypothetical protein [Mesorhizobium sp. M7A.F.Ca.MR.148.00.0.0]|uniref:hypothetical protein n=1 Tax=Mesorhizobium sp. M7A.F.Ca.MR.148.00.0.0 TaxID=2496775 RepID=UPI001FDFB626|nr:hypothetical protein [Mesorhizobium sp. M7A.F.Ca.MR.148.00.0.0]
MRKTARIALDDEVRFRPVQHVQHCVSRFGRMDENVLETPHQPLCQRRAAARATRNENSVGGRRACVCAFLHALFQRQRHEPQKLPHNPSRSRSKRSLKPVSALHPQFRWAARHETRRLGSMAKILDISIRQTPDWNSWMGEDGKSVKTTLCMGTMP